MCAWLLREVERSSSSSFFSSDPPSPVRISGLATAFPLLLAVHSNSSGFFRPEVDKSSSPPPPPPPPPRGSEPDLCLGGDLLVLLRPEVGKSSSPPSPPPPPPPRGSEPDSEYLGVISGSPSTVLPCPLAVRSTSSGSACPYSVGLLPPGSSLSISSVSCLVLLLLRPEVDKSSSPLRCSKLESYLDGEDLLVLLFRAEVDKSSSFPRGSKPDLYLGGDLLEVLLLGVDVGFDGP